MRSCMFWYQVDMQLWFVHYLENGEWVNEAEFKSYEELSKAMYHWVTYLVE